MRTHGPLTALLSTVAVFATLVLPAAPSAAAPPPGAESCPLFPADNVWHADVTSLAVHPRSEQWIASMGGPTRHLHPDLGPDGDGVPYGIPYHVVGAGAPRSTPRFSYAGESDPGPYPFSASTPIERGSDAHALVIDRDSCRLYELFAASWNGGSPRAGSGAIWDLRSNALRPRGWTSADAAGLPILPGLLRLDEVRAGHIDHPLRITASRTDRNFLWPARHHAGAAADPSLPPMGAWFRMRADVDISGFHPHTQVVLRAFQRHGAIVADNGSNWFVTGSADAGWDPRVIRELKSIPAGWFQAIDVSPLMVHPDSGQVRHHDGAAARRAQVRRLYLASFTRVPDDGGLAYWTAQLAGGRPLTAIAANFAASAELQARYGHLDAAGYVDRLYRNVLGRAADAGGLEYWITMLGNGRSRGWVLVGFSQSAENIARVG
ncbi:MAG: DUF4214 domain-containing protein [Acidimicrobiia bacterium]|nr:DUF4214 domain-containing protein [Acidimicrobiia bacterium]